MKVNFQETIKQKTDKELETISKDYVFYSEEERLIALNELETRSGLSNELLMYKKDLESSVEKAPPITEQALEAVKLAKKIYKLRAIMIGTFLGGPLVAGYFIAENFKVFNEINKARKTWNYTIIATVFIFIGVVQIPDHITSAKYSIPCIIATSAHFFAKHFQGRNILAFLALKGETYSWWRTIIVSLIWLAITFVSAVVVDFFIEVFS